jgi:hypothetical protein
VPEGTRKEAREHGRHTPSVWGPVSRGARSFAITAALTAIAIAGLPAAPARGDRATVRFASSAVRATEGVGAVIVVIERSSPVPWPDAKIFEIEVLDDGRR